MTATATVQATRPARRKTNAQRRSRPTPSHPTPTRTVLHKLSKPVDDAGPVMRGAPLTQWPAAGTDASRTAAIVVAAANEVLAGLHPVDHLVRWTSPSLFGAFARRTGLAARVLGGQSSPRRPRIRSVRTELTMSGICEATVLLEEGHRVRAMVARLELLRERWILTSLEMA